MNDIEIEIAIQEWLTAGSPYSDWSNEGISYDATTEENHYLHAMDYADIITPDRHQKACGCDESDCDWIWQYTDTALPLLQSVN